MKKYLFVLLTAVACVVASCTEKPVDDTVYTVEFKAPDGVVGVGNEVNFSDLSLNATGRVWTFQDAEPATSTEADVKVKFLSGGDKTVTLAVTFKNNKTLTETIAVKVADPIAGTIAPEGVTPLGCIKTGVATKFALADATGKADKFEWTFEGGSPATSTEATPTVTFENANRLGAKITCKMTRTSDGANETVDATYIIGNYPMNRPNVEANYDPYSFEMENSFVTLWTTKDETEKLSIVAEGAEGTGHSLKVPAIPDCPYPALIYRDNWPTNTALEPGKKYVLSFDHKAKFNGAPDNFAFVAVQMFNYLPDWAYNPYFDVTAGTGFSTYRTDAFADQVQLLVFEYSPALDENTGDIINPELMLSDAWGHVEYEFTCPDLYNGAKLLNVWPYMVLYNLTTTLEYILIDEIYISAVE